MPDITDPGSEDVLAACVRAGVVQVELQFPDITGAVKSVSIPARRLEEVLAAGEWFDGSAIEGAAREVESDMFLRPDPATFALIDPGADVICARLVCRVVTPDGRRYGGDSRAALESVLAGAREAGLEYLVAPEVEFFLFPDGEGGLAALRDDAGTYFERSGGRSRQAEMEIVHALESMGVAVQSSHHEVATGQYEVDLPLQPALAAADALTALKPAIKELARQRDMVASFMPKPLHGAAGSGMHTHQVLRHLDGRSAFVDEADPYGLSGTARGFIAGQLEHAPGMCALVAPLVNSYKRLVPGYEAPVAGSWGRHNRSALLRVPAVAGNAPEGDNARLEFRLPDPSCNPYLAFTAMLSAGMDGVERHLDPGPPMEELEHGYRDAARVSARPLPGSLVQALAALEADDLLVDVLGGDLLDLFLAAKRLEWAAYAMQVTPWELDRYLRAY
ncbi:MAG: glutamine synthetase family protein [Candidatus Dormibacteria bacterium]